MLKNDIYKVIYLIENNKSDLAVIELKKQIERIDHKMEHCAICCEKLTDEEFASIKATDFHIVCEKHIRFRDVWQLEETIRRENL